MSDTWKDTRPLQKFVVITTSASTFSTADFEIKAGDTITFAGVHEPTRWGRFARRIDAWYCRHLYFRFARVGWYFRNLWNALLGGSIDD